VPRRGQLLHLRAQGAVLRRAGLAAHREQRRCRGHHPGEDRAGGGRGLA
jgi:hypothetical protein